MLAEHALVLFDSLALFATGMVVAVGLGLVPALTPGHGKAVIFSYSLGHSARPLIGLRAAAGAAMTHGTLAVLLVLVGGRVLSLGRPVGAGAWLEATAGLIVAGIGAPYVVLPVRGLQQPTRHSNGGAQGSRPFLAVAMGLLPCPLTIIVVGSAMALLGGNIHRVLKRLAYLEFLTSLLILALGLFTVAGVAGRIR